MCIDNLDRTDTIISGQNAFGEACKRGAQAVPVYPTNITVSKNTFYHAR